jgi:Na+/H+-dicarboxylate symporter
MLSYLISAKTVDYHGKIDAIQSTVADTLAPSFAFHLPKLISNDTALLSGAMLGLIVFFVANKFATIASGLLERFTKIYFKILIPLMPFFIIGTALKLQTEGALEPMYEQYCSTLVLFLLFAYGWVVLQFWALGGFSFQRLLSYFKNLIPAIVTALSTASSAVALPLSVSAAEQNVRQKNKARIIIPLTVNIHLVGDCFFIPMVAIAVMHSFGAEFPGFLMYLLFAVHFVLAKFAVAAIPAGGIIVMLPILQEYLGLSADMQAIVMAVYVLFDPLITTCNVSGNGALAVIFDKLTCTQRKRADSLG